jgi:hypothetical protein
MWIIERYRQRAAAYESAAASQRQFAQKQTDSQRADALHFAEGLSKMAAIRAVTAPAE